MEANLRQAPSTGRRSCPTKDAAKGAVSLGTIFGQIFFSRSSKSSLSAVLPARHRRDLHATVHGKSDARLRSSLRQNCWGRTNFGSYMRFGNLSCRSISASCPLVAKQTQLEISRRRYAKEDSQKQHLWN